jgi:sugar lactone lactonase YvrE
MICLVDSAYSSAALTCDGLEEGDDCVYEYPGYPFAGTCMSGGGDRLLCTYTATGGGLDGLNVDGCGNIYVTEYGPGVVWRISPDGENVERAATLGSSWIPNLHFGPGAGGYERDKVYVMNYDGGGGLFEVDAGVRGRPEAHLPD